MVEVNPMIQERHKTFPEFGNSLIRPKTVSLKVFYLSLQCLTNLHFIDLYISILAIFFLLFFVLK
jgi:ABC-type long-subunit fatty acid transport system fused permease/ATPase subunit